MLSSGLCWPRTRIARLERILTLLFLIFLVRAARLLHMQRSTEQDVWNIRQGFQVENLLSSDDSPALSLQKDNLVILLCNEKYCPAVANLIASLRSDGGYVDDIAVIIDESENYTSNSLKEDISREGGNRNESLINTITFTSEELFNRLDLKDGKKFLVENPPWVPCVNHTDDELRRYRAYFLKSLMFHPVFTKWRRIMYMDSCVTIRSPHIDEIFSVPEVEGNILAEPDPWYWRKTGFAGKLDARCPDFYSTAELIQGHVGKKNLRQTPYFASGFALYDSSIIRDYGESSAQTLLEILALYHQLATVFTGDQEILSIYWIYKRERYRVMPLSMLDSNLVPYEFVKRIPEDPHIITAGHGTRPVCSARSTNNRTA